jgi:hypothetical protein
MIYEWKSKSDKELYIEHSIWYICVVEDTQGWFECTTYVELGGVHLPRLRMTKSSLEKAKQACEGMLLLLSSGMWY